MDYMQETVFLAAANKYSAYTNVRACWCVSRCEGVHACVHACMHVSVHAWYSMWVPFIDRVLNDRPFHNINMQYIW